jgi:hypothetical protein
MPPGVVVRGEIAHTAPGNSFAPGTPARAGSSVGFSSVHGRGLPMCGLCGFLYKDSARTGAVGRVLHGMLLPMGRRGTDSTGIAMYGSPQADSYVLRARIEANSGRGPRPRVRRPQPARPPRL